MICHPRQENCERKGTLFCLQDKRILELSELSLLKNRLTGTALEPWDFLSGEVVLIETVAGTAESIKSTFTVASEILSMQ